MKLELKHLASYLPYKLKVASGDWYDEDCKLDRIGTMVMNYDNYTPNNISINQLCGNIDGKFTIYGVIKRKAKPILRPLSDLTKEIDGVVHLVNIANLYLKPRKHTIDNNRAVSKHGYLEFEISTNRFFERDGGSELFQPTYSFYMIEYLFQHHFDVYGLIEKGLAVDINNIENV